MELNWGRIPFICFKYNDEELPLIKYIKQLVDDYDINTSDLSNQLKILQSLFSFPFNSIIVNLLIYKFE